MEETAVGLEIDFGISPYQCLVESTDWFSSSSGVCEEIKLGYCVINAQS